MKLAHSLIAAACMLAAASAHALVCIDSDACGGGASGTPVAPTMSEGWTFAQVSDGQATLGGVTVIGNAARDQYMQLPQYGLRVGGTTSTFGELYAPDSAVHAARHDKCVASCDSHRAKDNDSCEYQTSYMTAAVGTTSFVGGIIMAAVTAQFVGPLAPRVGMMTFTTAMAEGALLVAAFNSSCRINAINLQNYCIDKNCGGR